MLDLLRAGGPLSLVAGTDGAGGRGQGGRRRAAVGCHGGDAVRCLALQARHRLLCAHRHGPYGVSRWNEQIMPVDRRGAGGVARRATR